MKEDNPWNFVVNDIIDYESGDMVWDRLVAFFQSLIDTGLAWQLQGHYGRTAMELAREGYCTLPPDGPHQKRLNGEKGGSSTF